MLRLPFTRIAGICKPVWANCPLMTRRIPRRVSYMLQKRSPWSIRQPGNIILPLLIQKVDKAAIDRADGILATFQLPIVSDKYPHEPGGVGCVAVWPAQNTLSDSFLDEA